MRKERNKLKPSDLIKIQARFKMKYEEFDKLPLYDEFEEDGTTVKVTGLRTIFREKKMSTTDKRALVAVVDSRLKKQMDDVRRQSEQGEVNPVKDKESGEEVPDSVQKVETGTDVQPG